MLQVSALLACTQLHSLAFDRDSLARISRPPDRVRAMPARAMGRQRTPLPCPATQGTAPQTSAPTRAPIPRAYGGCDALPSVLPLTSPNSSPSHMCPNALPSDQPPFYPTTLTHTRIYISTMPRRTDSDRHVPRNDSYMAFHGSGGTNAAHKMSWEVYNGVGAHMGGRPATQHEPIARAMGARSNLRDAGSCGDHRKPARENWRRRKTDARQELPAVVGAPVNRSGVAPTRAPNEAGPPLHHGTHFSAGDRFTLWPWPPFICVRERAECRRAARKVWDRGPRDR